MIANLVVSDIRVSPLLVTGGKEMTVSPSIRQGYTGQLSSKCKYWCMPATELRFFSFLRASVLRHQLVSLGGVGGGQGHDGQVLGQLGGVQQGAVLWTGRVWL